MFSSFPSSSSTAVICRGSKKYSEPSKGSKSKMNVVIDHTKLDGPKRTLSMSQMLLLNSIVCGLEFCASAAFCYIPPMLLKAGLPEEDMSRVLGIGPLLGFFFVPIIGRASDKCRSRIGRRRPFILGLSAILILSLLVIPYGETLGEYIIGKGERSKHIGVILLIVGSVMLDFSSQVCLTPCEALLSDASRHTDQYDTCFTVYSFMVSIGGCIGYLITALDWSDNSVANIFGTQEQTVFAMLIILFSLSAFATLGVVQEAQVEDEVQPKQRLHSQNSFSFDDNFDQINQTVLHQKDLVQKLASDMILSYENENNHSTYQSSSHRISSPRNKESVPSFSIYREKNSSWTLLSTSEDSLLQLLLHRIYQLLPDIIKSLLDVPYVLRPLALANFCSWTAIMGFNLFFTDFVGQEIYGGDPNADEGSPLRELYDIGVRMGSWGLLVRCITSAVYATCVEKNVLKYGTRMTYLMGMLSFTIAMMLMVMTKNIYIVTILAACTGFGFATVTIIPFMLITLYHDHKEIFFYDIKSGRSSIKSSGGSGAHGVATDMATLDSAYFFSQVALSAVMGYLVHVTGTVMAYIAFSCFMGGVACFFINKIITNKMQMQMYLNIRHRHGSSGYGSVDS